MPVGTRKVSGLSCKGGLSGQRDEGEQERAGPGSPYLSHQYGRSRGFGNGPGRVRQEVQDGGDRDAGGSAAPAEGVT